MYLQGLYINNDNCTIVMKESRETFDCHFLVLSHKKDPLSEILARIAFAKNPDGPNKNTKFYTVDLWVLFVFDGTCYSYVMSSANPILEAYIEFRRYVFSQDYEEHLDRKFFGKILRKVRGDNDLAFFLFGFAKKNLQKYTVRLFVEYEPYFSMERPESSNLTITLQYFISGDKNMYVIKKRIKSTTKSVRSAVKKAMDSLWATFANQLMEKENEPR